MPPVVATAAILMPIESTVDRQLLHFAVHGVVIGGWRKTGTRRRRHG
jgi:hypothetical protein